MKKTNIMFRLYLKYLAWFIAFFASIALVFVPMMPTVLSLMGFESFLGITFSGETEKSYVNVLLMGLDKDETRSDVMMVAQLNLESNSVNILQIPRDTYIQNNRFDKKINSAYGAGGPERSIKEVQTLIDIDIDKYAIVTTSGFRDLIDAVGGVYYDIPMDMNYDDDLQDLHIHLKAGYQLLDGDKAEQYVRCRYIYPNGDLGRVEAQSGFIKEAIDQIIERFGTDKTLDTGKLLSTLGDMVDTNFTMSEMLKYSPFLLNINMDHVNIMMLEGQAEYRNHISYFIANKAKNDKIIKEYFTPNISEADLSEIQARDEAIGRSVEEYNVADSMLSNILPSDINVFVLDYSGTSGHLLATTVNILESSGYKIVGEAIAQTATADKTYCVSSPNSQLSSKVAADLGLEHYHINPDYNNNADVVLVLGKEE
ncbi:MAG: LytR family transcriptional regulator [Ruminococcaceae bacterium]|nr:LytR family transcriptional regulator [Oscillospiraceae bacterium]